jgi:hypothetical protein
MTVLISSVSTAGLAGGPVFPSSCQYSIAFPIMSHLAPSVSKSVIIGFELDGYLMENRILSHKKET